MVGCGGGCARSGSSRCHCTFKLLRTRPSPVARNGISRSTISSVSLPNRISLPPAYHISYVRDEMASRRNIAPQSPDTDPRYGGGDVLGDGRGLDRRRPIGHQDPCVQSPDGCVESDVGWLSGRGLGRLVGRERVVVIVFSEEEHKFWFRWMGTENFIGCEWRM